MTLAFHPGLALSNKCLFLSWIPIFSLITGGDIKHMNFADIIFNMYTTSYFQMFGDFSLDALQGEGKSEKLTITLRINSTSRRASDSCFLLHTTRPNWLDCHEHVKPSLQKSSPSPKEDLETERGKYKVAFLSR